MRMTHFFKIVQKRTYDILSNRRTLFGFIAFFIVLPTTFIVTFEKILLIWNSQQSLVLFRSDYVGLMIDKSSRSIGLCENKPAIDVVYTWVNGSEANFLRNLLKVKRNYLEMVYGDQLNCSIPLECTTKNHQTSSNDLTKGQSIYMDTTLIAIDTSIDLRGLKMLQSKSIELITTESFGNHYNLIHLTQEGKSDLVNYFALHSNVNPVKSIYAHIECSNFTLSNERLNLVESFISSNVIYLSSTSSSIESSFSSRFFSSSSSSSWFPPRKQFLKLFNEKEKLSIRNVVFHSSRRSAIILLDPLMASRNNLIDHLESLGHRYNFTVTQSPTLYLGEDDLVQCSNDKITESMTINRFADNDELRYSLRSVEKFAPWVRNIYLVTNGQIPDWLNVEDPRLRLISHEDIFPDKSDLPTFNSVAIEIHLHRIVGLSEKFLYFNDDIMLGKPVYLEDFYSPTSGYKIYQAWPVPNCESGCPTSWLSDGFCDLTCNTTLCLFDGGDCLNKTLTSRHGSILKDHANFRGGPSFFSASRPITDQCQPSCADFWLGDKYCDNACNHPDCAFDMGDCGLNGYSTIPGQSLIPHRRCFLYPSPTPSIYLNLSELISIPKFELISASYTQDYMIRSVVLNLQHQLITILFSTNVTDFLVPIELRYKIDEMPYDLSLELNVTSSIELTPPYQSVELPSESSETTKNDLNIVSITIDDNVTIQADPIIIFSLNSSSINNNKSLIHYMTIIDMETSNFTGDQVDEDVMRLLHSLVSGQYNERPIGVYPWENEKTFKRLGDLIANYEKYSKINDRSMVKTTSRQLMDIFLDSINYVNHLYNRVFGIKMRKIVAHSPILLDKSIIARLWEQFPDELSKTSSHKLRSSNDMQFSFSYFNFLMSETVPVNYKQLIEQFDTDNSKSLSANELRSFLVNLVPPPIIQTAWSNYSDCWNGSNYELMKKEGYEWTFDQLLGCQRIVDALNKKFSSMNRNLYTLTSDLDVSFTMIREDWNQLINKLDGLRRDPKKFLCFNDDIQRGNSKETDLIRSSLTDYYQYLVPTPSSFELRDGSINSFKDISTYRSWKLSKQLSFNNLNQSSSTWIYFTLYGSILFFIIYKVLTIISTRSRSDNIIRV